jgi:hypothetical protein
MVDILKNFEQMASRFSPLVLIAPGLLVTVLGLFVWLGGLGFRRALLALVGAAMGASCALLTVPESAAVIVLASLAMAFVGASFQRFFTAVLLGALSFAITFGILARPFLREYRGSLISGAVGQDNEILTVGETLEVVRAAGLDLADGLRYAARRLAPQRWAIAAAVSAGLLAIGLLFRHVGGALSCSILGTGLIFAGLALLIALKGAAPVARMQNQAALYALVFIGMIGFGTLEQLVLCSHSDQKQRKLAHQRTTHDNKSKKGWRNR